MTAVKRRFLALVFTLLFIFIGAGVVLYSQGWRINFRTLAANKVGAIYIRSYPKDAQIFINGQEVRNDSWLFQNGTLINNLFPGEYAIELKRSGYRSWREKIAVRPSVVSEIKYAIMIPENERRIAEAPAAAAGVYKFNGSFIVKSNGRLLISDAQIPGTEVLQWTDNFKKLLTRNESGEYFLYDEANKISVKLSNVYPSYQNFYLDSEDGDYLIMKDALRISLYDDSAGKISPLFAASTTKNISGAGRTRSGAVSAFRFNIAFTIFDPQRSISQLVLYDAFLQRQKVLALAAGGTSKLEVLKNGNIALVQDDGGFYIYDSRRNSLDKVASDAISFYFTKDLSRVAVLERSGLEIFIFGDYPEYFRYRMPDIGDVQKLEWHKDGEHLLVYRPREIRFFDIRDTNIENLQKIADNSGAFYDEETNSLYNVRDSGIYQLQFP